MTPVLFLIFGPPVKEQQRGLELLHGARLYAFSDFSKIDLFIFSDMKIICVKDDSIFSCIVLI